jgi:predicted Zn-dependent peptidase
LYGKPRDGQNLEEVEKLLWQEVENLRQGNFDAWLPGAVIKDLKLSEIKEFEKNQGRASAITAAFVLGIEWAEIVKRWEKLERVTKADVVAFARKHLHSDNYVTVYKHHGDDPSVMKVEKPPITAVELNRTDISDFGHAFLQQSTPDIEPQFLDFRKVIRTARLAPGLNLKSVHQPDSRLFRLYYIFEMGKTSDRRLSLAAAYLPFLGTSQYSPREMQQAFYRLGVHFSATCKDDRMYLTLSGLDDSMEEGIQLMEHLLADARPNPEALENLKADVLMRRENNKKDKRTILNKAMLNFGKYGKLSPFSDKQSKDELLAIQADVLTGLLRDLPSFRHEVFYSGRSTSRQVAGLIKKHHRVPEVLQAPLPARKYKEANTRKNNVYFVHFPMVQTELLLISRGTPKFNLDEYIFSEWYNQYFGYGLSSIVFQEIRESKALAYSAYVYAANPARRKQAHFLQAYVGTQPDKVQDAIRAFQTILEDMPVSHSQMEHARQSVLKQIAAGRIHHADIYWTWRSNADRGVQRDLRQDVYETLQNASAEDLLHFHQKHIKGRKFNWMILGDRNRIDFGYLNSLGKISELRLEDVFGY